MNYHHPSIRVEQPAPGHYVITGHNPASVLVPETGHIVPLAQCYIPPELPSDVLLAIVADRGDLPADDAAGHERPAPGHAASKRTAKGGRK